MIVARSHTKSFGEMSKEEHASFISFTADSMRDLYERHPHANRESVRQHSVREGQKGKCAKELSARGYFPFQ